MLKGLGGSRVATTVLVTYTGLGLSLVSTPLIARALGASGRGELAASFAVLQVVEFAAFLGLPRGLALARARGGRISRANLHILLLLGVLAGAAMYFAAGPLSNGNSRVEWGQRVVAVAFVINGIAQVGGQTALTQGKLTAFNLYRSFPLIAPSLVSIMAYPLGLLTWEVAFWSVLLSSMTSSLVGFCLVWRATTPGRLGDLPWTDSLRYWSATTLDILCRRVDIPIGAAVLSAREFGVYAVAATLAAASGGVTQALHLVGFSKAVLGDSTSRNKSTRRFFALRVSASLLLALAVSGTIALIEEPLFGTTFRGLTLVTSIMCLAQVARDTWTWTVDTGTAHTRARLYALPSLVSLAVFVGIIAWLSQADAMSGPSLAWSAVTMSSTGLITFVLLSWAYRYQERRDHAQS